MSEKLTDISPVIAMVQGQMLIFLCNGRQATLHVGCAFYAAEIAAAVNAVTSETMEEDAARALSEGDA
jgi:hypothetical protein